MQRELCCTNVREIKKYYCSGLQNGVGTEEGENESDRASERCDILADLVSLLDYTHIQLL